MKKSWVLSFVLVMTAVVGFACGGGDDPTATTKPTSTSPAPTATSPTASQATATPESSGGGVALSIGSVSTDDLEFDTESLTASAGAEVVLTFSNNAILQQHNWVLVQNGTKDDVAAGGLTAGPANNWVPVGDANVITNTPLIAAGESTEITFTAPAAGTYQFVCTFPGHAPTMFGTFEVT